MKRNILISACLIGMDCKYNGGNNENQALVDLIQQRPDCCFIPVCPEQLGGLCTPREPCELMPDKKTVKAESGIDLTLHFIKGAEETLKLARLFDCTTAILKENSPSCGSNTIYDGTFSHIKTDGNGVTSSFLKANGITVYSEENFLL